MTAIDPSLIETLLYMSESDVLDFKRDQYPLAGATEDQKAEIVKDIVAFANAWKTTDAHIVIGADENPGGRATIVGAIDHLDDADLQQLVNGKTNVPVAFEYVPVGNRLAILRIKRDQQRPIYLRKQFGKLKAGVVYIRRGSSTAEALPDEVARMGASAVSSAQEPVLAVEMADPDERKRHGASVVLVSTVLEDPPPPPRALQAWASRQRYGIADFLTATDPFTALGRPDTKHLAAHRREMALLRSVGFRVENIGGVLVEDVRIIIEIPKAKTLRVVDELPEKPRGPLDLIIPSFRGGGSPARFTRVTEVGDAWEVQAAVGKLQPNATGWSLPFWIGSDEEREFTIVARVYGDNIARAIEVPMTIRIDVAHGFLEYEEHCNDAE